MTQKKDRRSARTRKRDDHNATGLPAWPYASGENVCIRMVRGDRVSGANFWLVAPHDFSVSDWVPCVMPSLPRSHSSSAPMVPEVSP